MPTASTLTRFGRWRSTLSPDFNRCRSRHCKTGTRLTKSQKSAGRVGTRCEGVRATISSAARRVRLALESENRTENAGGKRARKLPAQGLFELILKIDYHALSGPSYMYTWDADAWFAEHDDRIRPTSTRTHSNPTGHGTRPTARSSCPEAYRVQKYAHACHQKNK
jgi:hypothetical protein